MPERPPPGNAGFDASPASDDADEILTVCCMLVCLVAVVGLICVMFWN